jgi:sigma-B regulation protein RsbU (phosphoserine phosphatase)
VRAFAAGTVEPQALCGQVNRILCGNIAEGRFISFCYCVLDTAEGILTYSNAGHYPPAVVRANGTIERLDRGGPVFGVIADAEYEQAEIALQPGDRLVLYTDGLTEARDAAGEEFGEARLLEAAVRHRDCSAPALQARLAADVAAFTGARLQDDATLIVAASEL